MSAKNKGIYKKFLFSFSSMFVLFSAVVLKSNSILLWGEVECPKELLK